MDQKLTGLSLLILAVIASGCGGGGGQVSGHAISVQGPQIQPSSIFEGSSTRVSMRATNTGEIESEVTTGENGEKILTNHCPDFFNIAEEEGFRASTSTATDTKESYTLEPEENLQLNWKLNQEGGNIPLNGYECPLKFQIPFSYSVEAYKQILIKERDAEIDTQLPSRSSQGPLNIEIETIGSSSERGAPVFLEGDQPEVLMRIVNTQPEESSYQGLVELRKENLEITDSGINLEEDCLDEELEGPINLYHGQSQIIRCNVEYDLGGQPSVKGEVRVSADYKYVRSIGERTVEVKYSGD